MENTDAVLDDLLQRLESRGEQPRLNDAIDDILVDKPRRTSARSLRDDETVKRFRQELSDGLIQADTAGRLIELIRSAVQAAMA